MYACMVRQFPVPSNEDNSALMWIHGKSRMAYDKAFKFVEAAMLL